MQLLAGGRFLTYNKQGYGTVGGFFTLPNMPRKVYGLTNSHVVAACGINNPKGADIHGGLSPFPVVGKVVEYSVIDAVGFNTHDYALVELNNNIQPVWGFPRPTGYVPPYELANYYGRPISIHGASSGYSGGVVSALAYEVYNINIPDCNMTVNFGDVIVAYNPMQFSSIGDSGSLMISEDDGRILGVLIGGWPGDNRFSFGFPFWKLINYHNLELF